MHSENVVLLAENFGDVQDLKEAKSILALHRKEGSLSMVNGRKRELLHRNLISRARAEMQKEGIEFKNGGMMADGGGISNEEKLLKELYKLQRELNSSRLQTYKLGDTSDEEMARQRERASKLERFNEVLKELNDKEIKYARGGSTDHKYLNHSQDYEVRYAKGRNRHGYGNLKFATGGAMMANQQIMDDASQHYVNYYLNDGASAGMFKDGGAIKNQYAGRTSEDIWNNLSRGQRSHFLYDHMDEIQEYKDFRISPSQIRVAINSDWYSLDKDIKNRFSNHVREGQYATGGMMPKPSTSKHRND
jgi:hypothetical protein